MNLFFHALAILHASAYRAENTGALRMDSPRIPWPNSKALLVASAALGRAVAALLDVEQTVQGVTTAKVREDLKTVGSLTTDETDHFTITTRRIAALLSMGAELNENFLQR